ncbi:Smr/MutS family protein [Desulfomicrobium sp. ZS1]|uniref:endonuclease MutS2 n=1 Tax=Desulfomicrobium sp. ZS1 TaxID=2952228 RepID=UPI0020B1F62A|nr:Smr/MutS family protein [Desulfomicrobium sp. ZS1]UTF50418.1 Smr/MutS family protein [Desulfomicrobium sp. ZS1]
MDSRTLQLLEYPKVLQHLSHFAVSEAGRDACLSLLPETDPVRIAERSALVREAIHFCAFKDVRLAAFPDVAGVFAYLQSPLAFLDVDGLIGLFEMLKVAAALLERLGPADSERYPGLAALVAGLTLPPKTWSGLSRCLAPDGTIRDEASPELYSVRQEIRRVHQMCTRKVQDFFQNKDLQFILQDEFLTISSDRYVLALKNNFKGRLKGIVHDYSQTGETCYFEPLFLVELNNDLQEYKQEERAEEQKVLRFLSELVRAEQRAIELTFDELVRFDGLLAICHFARHSDAHVVDIAPGAPLSLIQARHPLLVFGQDHVVPVDLELKAGQRALIITGGNAGGKTVCLKTLGLLGLMAHAGLPVTAAEGSTLPFWNNFVVSMGDEQSIEQSLSTFTAQIRHFSEVWPRIDTYTLVILDEFGVGTDPSQGAALAQAVVDGLLERQAWVGAVTHFPALKAYGLSKDGVRAASVIFSPDTRKPLFKLGYDQVGASRALDVAREQGLPESILARAQDYLYLDAGDAEEIFERLNRLAAAKEEELDKARARTRDLELKFSRKLEKLDQERSRMQKELREAAQEIMRQWREGRRGRKEALKEIAQLRDSVAPSPETDEAIEKLSIQAIAQGQVLLYLPWNKTGLVQEIDGKKERVRLDMGGVSLWVGLSDVQVSAKEKHDGGKVVLKSAPAPVTPLRLDLRGMRADEAESELSRFLDKALLAGRTEVEIIHGMGTGAMRRMVHEHLKRSRAVGDFRLGNADEGGDGVTKVALAD